MDSIYNMSNNQNAQKTIERIRATSIHQSNTAIGFGIASLLFAIRAIINEVHCASEPLCGQHYRGYGTAFLGFLIFICIIINASLCSLMTVSSEKVSPEFQKEMVKRKRIVIVLMIIPACIIATLFIITALS